MSSRVDQQQFAESAAGARREIDARLTALLTEQADGTPVMQEALRYVVMGGGKRLRPLLCLWTHDHLGGGERDACLDVACALEFLHTYSLVHDDLPCMDDDALRRGQPSCHKKFGEGTAVLVGDALLTLCFETITNVRARWELASDSVVEVLRVVGRAAGMGGLITGQALDLAASVAEGALAGVERIHNYKTAALIAASMESGAVIAGADLPTREKLHHAGRLAGRAFQIVDDLLDIESNAESLGKTPGKDAEDGKLTYPAVAGRRVSRRKAEDLIAEAIAELEPLGGEPLLAMLIATLVARKR